MSNVTVYKYYKTLKQWRVIGESEAVTQTIRADQVTELCLDRASKIVVATDPATSTTIQMSGRRQIESYGFNYQKVLKICRDKSKELHRGWQFAWYE